MRSLHGQIYVWLSGADLKSFHYAMGEEEFDIQLTRPHGGSDDEVGAIVVPTIDSPPPAPEPVEENVE